MSPPLAHILPQQICILLSANFTGCLLTPHLKHLVIILPSRAPISTQNPLSPISPASGNNFKPFFLEVCTNCASALVKHTLKGALHHHGCPTACKSPLATSQLQTITTDLINSPDHNDMLFLSMINTSFPGLLHLGKIAVSDNPHLRNFWKVVLHNSLV